VAQIDVSRLIDPSERKGSRGPSVAFTVRRILHGAPAGRRETLYFQLATMLDSGVPLREALFTLSEQYRGRAGAAFRRLADDVATGISLSDAMARQPESFDPLTVSMVHSGETVGRLDENLDGLAENLERTRRLVMRLVTGFIYPLLLLHAAILIPNLLVLVRSGLGPYLLACLPPLLILYSGAFALWFLHQIFRETSAYGGLLLSLPVVEKLVYARFARSLAILYQGGVPLAWAVEMAGAASGNGSVRGELDEVAIEVSAGAQLGEALRYSPRFPEMVLNMIRTGEHTGRLDATLRKVAEYYEQGAEATIERTARVLPVVAYLLVAGYIGYIVFTMWANVYGQVFSLF
jgi:type II secretory pathway component PulF